ncbi:MAG TPA: hypothetical protein ENJ89_05905 [Caldithrix abyssi]|uniref:Uncharacterized protein n=1 Tax=Caldithrix abyssi TaxID=187145 RepID=A0A7V5UEU7_CALAY|nr:hypothetical protein [Caldithrix abyssi]
MESLHNRKVLDVLPIFMFIGSYFIFHLFEWREVTCTIWATVVSLLTFLFLVADFKMEHKKEGNFSRLNFYGGLLSLLTLVIVAQGFLHWQRVLPIVWRMLIFFTLLVIYFVLLFRGMRTLTEFKQFVENKAAGNKKRKQ